MALSLVTLFFTAVTFSYPAIYLASSIVYSFQCEKIRCSSSTSCPPWHYCNLHQRTCEPCTRCIDGSDVFRSPAANCQDPLFCIDSLYAKQDYDSSCPKLRIAERSSCWGECTPCGGTFGSYLGTECRARCEDGDWEVFSCIFLNEVAQWNVSRMPRWVEYKTPSTPPRPPLTSPTPPSPSTAPAVYHLESIVGIVVGTVLGVAVIVFFAVVLIVCVRRREAASKWDSTGTSAGETLIKESPGPPPASPGKVPVQQSEPMTFDSVREPVEVLEPNDEVPRNDASHPLRQQPTEISDDESIVCFSRYSKQANARVRAWLEREQHLSLVSLHSDRPNRQPQQHSPALVNSPPVGYSDSGHPPCKLSSSTSLQDETPPRESAMDGRRGPHREAIEHYDETSSGFHRRESTLERNTSVTVYGGDLDC